MELFGFNSRSARKALSAKRELETLLASRGEPIGFACIVGSAVYGHRPGNDLDVLLVDAPRSLSLPRKYHAIRVTRGELEAALADPRHYLCSALSLPSVRVLGDEREIGALRARALGTFRGSLEEGLGGLVAHVIANDLRRALNSNPARAVEATGGRFEARILEEELRARDSWGHVRDLVAPERLDSLVASSLKRLRAGAEIRRALADPERYRAAFPKN